MARKSQNLFPIIQAIILHIALFVIAFFAFDWPHQQPQSITPMAIKAKLVVENIDKPELIVKKEIKSKKQIQENKELQIQAEEKKRINDALVEKKRLEKIHQKAKADRIKKDQERKKRLKQEEQRRERELKEAELKRINEIERQRAENKRIRKELEADVRQAEIDAESKRFGALKSGDLSIYKNKILQKIERNWKLPVGAPAELDCSVRVQQIPGGVVAGVTILKCNGDEAVKRSIVAAIKTSSPLPEPSNPILFDRSILINLSKKQ
ncbi:MAG: hypothetical protein CMQ54_05010 [Gammaproteobacteria bacterium]|nr:hypothetical protein [Gammaproteobacteria bacterium]